MASELIALADYSWTLWQIAYEPMLLSSDLSRLLWERSYSSSALEAAYFAGEKLFWVWLNGCRAGFVGYRLEAASRTMRLTKLYLDPDHWGIGLGHWVLESVTNTAKGAGADDIQLYVFRQNARALRAYQRAGFVILREEFSDLGGGVIYDDYVMIKSL